VIAVNLAYQKTGSNSIAGQTF